MRFRGLRRSRTVETETELIVWAGWPPAGATRDEMIASLRLLMEKHVQDQARREMEHAAALGEWRSTIADRLLALIPKLETGESIELWSPKPSRGYQSDFEAPRLHEYAPEETWLEDKLAVLQALPPGPVSAAIRRALMMSAGT